MIEIAGGIILAVVAIYAAIFTAYALFHLAAVVLMCICWAIAAPFNLVRWIYELFHPPAVAPGKSDRWLK